jgi:hypothetical protein
MDEWDAVDKLEWFIELERMGFERVSHRSLRPAPDPEPPVAIIPCRATFPCSWSEVRRVPVTRTVVDPVTFRRTMRTEWTERVQPRDYTFHCCLEHGHSGMHEARGERCFNHAVAATGELYAPGKVYMLQDVGRPDPHDRELVLVARW